MPCDPLLIAYRAELTGDVNIVTQQGTCVSAIRTSDENADGYGYISHFATCPSASFFRKSR